MKQEPTKQEYARHIEKITPRFNSYTNFYRAFISGGLICLLAEIIRQTAITQFGMEQENASVTVSICLIALSVLLTGFSIYGRMAKWCGAGTLVPISGFANSVASAAIEYRKEGQVFGIGVKIFTIAGPVILYGIFASWCVGFIYWLIRTI